MNELMSLRSRASAGDPASQVRLAHMILSGRVPGSSLEAMQLIRNAGERRHGDALLYHAALAVRGHGRPQSLKDALELLQQAAAYGDTRARGQLAALGGKIDRAEWVASAPMVQHHAAPRIFTLKGVLPKPVCNWLIKFSKKNLQPATTQSAATGGALSVDDARSNTVASTSQLHHDVPLQLACLRIAAITGLPLIHQEATNMLHYGRGQRYLHHYDFIRAEEESQPAFARELSTIGQRVLTFLIYLNDEYEGGETEFPLLNWKFRGQTGDALMFWNLSASGERELQGLHAGLEVTKGEKWLLSKWIRQRPVPLL